MDITKEQIEAMTNLQDDVTKALEAAFRDGWNMGYGAGLSDGHPINRACGDEDASWEESDTKATIEASV